MALSIVNNVSSLMAQYSLNGTSRNLNQSLQRLSSGLKINQGSDGPAALVISSEQQAQITGLNTAIDNTNKAINLVQTAEGALSQQGDLLTQIRGLAVDSANSGVQDATSLAANSAQIQNAIATINAIANTTQFGTTHLIDGSMPGAVFKLGADGKQTAQIGLQDTHVAAGSTTAMSGLASAASAFGAAPTSDSTQALVTAVDLAIAENSGFRGKLGAFQSNTLQVSSVNLQMTLDNTTAAESTTRGTDYAEEAANSTKFQVQLQAGIAALSTANQTSQLVLKLLQ